MRMAKDRDDLLAEQILIELVMIATVNATDEVLKFLALRLRLVREEGVAVGLEKAANLIKGSGDASEVPGNS
jgi:hypothetical protein